MALPYILFNEEKLYLGQTSLYRSPAQISITNPDTTMKRKKNV